MADKSPEKVPDNMRSRYESIVRLTDDFCQQHLDEEYAELARKMTATLARKRPSPLASSAVESWACGIIYALGRVNFLFDKTQTPHMKGEEVCAGFGVGKSTGPSKSKQIWDMLKLTQMDPNWYRPSKLDDNPVAWFIQVNGLIVDARHMSREIQEEAFRRGLIPYIP